MDHDERRHYYEDDLYRDALGRPARIEWMDLRPVDDDRIPAPRARLAYSSRLVRFLDWLGGGR